MCIRFLHISCEYHDHGKNVKNVRISQFMVSAWRMCVITGYLYAGAEIATPSRRYAEPLAIFLRRSTGCQSASRSYSDRKSIWCLYWCWLKTVGKCLSNWKLIRIAHRKLTLYSVVENFDLGLIGLKGTRSTACFKMFLAEFIVFCQNSRF